MTLYTAVITLILVMDPLGNIPAFLSVLSHVERRKRKRIILRETSIAFVVLTVFLIFGQYILEGTHISQSALGISGGIILFLISLRMIFPHEESEARIRKPEDPFIVPLAIPLIAGPSTMAVVMLMAIHSPKHIPLWFLALFISWLISTIILVFADKLSKLLGEKGLIALERLMGMILTTMAVQMFLSGIQQFFHLA